MAAFEHTQDWAFAQDAGAPGEAKDAVVRPVPSYTPPASGRAGLVTALVRQVLIDLRQPPAGAHPAVTGRLAALSRPESAVVAPQVPRVEFERVHARVPLPITSLVAPLVAWTLSAPDEPAADRAAWLRGACAHRDIAYANVIEACARALGDRCRDDACTELDVTLALFRLQAVVRWIGAAPDGLRAFAPWRARVAAAPLEPHGLGMAIASECFRATGWDVDESPCSTNEGMRDSLAECPCDVLVLSLSDAHRRAGRVAALGHTIAAARATNPRMLVYVTGRAFTELAASAADVGADGACASAVDAPRLATRDLRLRAAARRTAASPAASA